MKRSICVALVATLSILGACGDDDDASPTTGDPSSDETTATTAAEGDGEQAAGDGDFCTAYQELLAGDPSPDAIREVAEIAPEGAQEPLETIATGFETDGEGFFGSPPFNEAFAEVGGIAADECADEQFDVKTVDYAFEGIPEQLSPGVVGFNITNEGTEFHELLLFRKNADTAQSFEEIFAMEQEEAQALVTEVGASFMAPGATAGGLYDMSEAGEYAAVCFIPVGTVDMETESDGPPHFTQGMLSTFTVG